MIYLCVDILSVSIFYLHACNYSQDGDFVCYDSYNYRYVQGALKEKDWGSLRSTSIFILFSHILFPYGIISLAM